MAHWTFQELIKYDFLWPYKEFKSTSVVKPNLNITCCYLCFMFHLNISKKKSAPWRKTICTTATYTVTVSSVTKCLQVGILCFYTCFNQLWSFLVVQIKWLGRPNFACGPHFGLIWFTGSGRDTREETWMDLLVVSRKGTIKDRCWKILPRGWKCL